MRCANEMTDHDKASFPFCSSAGLPVQDSMPWPWNKSHNAKNVGESSSRRASPNASSKESTRQEDDADQAAQSAEAHLQHLYAFPHMLMPKGNRRQRIRDKLSAHDGTTDDSFFSQGDETVLPAIRSHKPSLISQTHKNPPPKSPIKFRRMKSMVTLSSPGPSPPKQEGHTAQSDDKHAITAQADENATECNIKDNVQVDCLWECQRGLLLFSLPTFSANALLNFDPKPWVTYENGKCRGSAYTRENYPLPSADWVWLDAAFLINMANDAAVDEQGWSYAFCFANRRHWLGHCRWYSFVRRRQWLRARMRVTNQDASEAIVEQQTRLSRSHSAAPTENTLPHPIDLPHPTRPPSMRVSSSNYKKLPLSEVDMERLIANEAYLDPRNPFLSWSVIKHHGLQAYPWMAHDETHQKMWKENVIEINLERAMRCLKIAKVDRERTQLWKHWLGIELLTVVPFCPKLDPQPSISPNHTPTPAQEDDVEDLPRPDIQDVWDLAEAKLDDLLLAYFFQSSREELLNLLPEAHSRTHKAHRFRSWDYKLTPDAIAAYPQIDWSDFQTAHILPRISFAHDVERPAVTRFQMMREKRKPHRDASYATARDGSITSQDSDQDAEADGTAGSQTPIHMVMSASPGIMTPRNSSPMENSYFSVSQKSSFQHLTSEPPAVETHAFTSPSPQQPALVSRGSNSLTVPSSDKSRSLPLATPYQSLITKEAAAVPLPPSPPASDDSHS